jgi:hypothetical protein
MRYVGSQGGSTANEKLISDTTHRHFKNSRIHQKNLGDCALKSSVVVRIETPVGLSSAFARIASRFCAIQSLRPPEHFTLTLFFTHVIPDSL